MVAIPTKAPTLAGERVTLDQLDESVLDDYWQLLNDTEVARWTGPAQTFTQQKISQWLISRPQQDDRLDWAIHPRETGAFAGEIVLNELDLETKCMNLRIALCSEFQNQGFGTEAIQLVCDFGLDVLGLHKITLGVMTDNLRAHRTYEKVGFQFVETYQEADITYIAMEITKKTSHF